MTELTPEQTEIVKRTAKLMGNLFIARRDVKAIEGNGGWFPVREQCTRHEPHKRCAQCNEAPTIPFKMGDFAAHLFGDKCLGSYLLDTDNNVRFIAFDVDLKKEGAQWWRVEDIGVIDEATAAEAATPDGELDITKTYTGDLEASLHDQNHLGYRWGRILLRSILERLANRVESELGLGPLIVITGGGGHVLVPFPEKVPASDARAMARNVVETAGFVSTKGDLTFWGTPGNPSFEIELFPKQDTLSPSGASYGNLIRLPLGIHRRTGVRTFFLDTTDYEGVPYWEYRRVGGLKTLEAAAAALGVQG